MKRWSGWLSFAVLLASLAAMVPAARATEPREQSPLQDGVWEVVTSPTGNSLWGVDMVNADEGWAVGQDGAMVRYRNGQWQNVSGPGVETLHAVDMVSLGDGWAVGGGGQDTILHYSGGSWAPVEPTGYWLNGVYMVSGSLGWAVGSGGTILYYSGGQWQDAASPTTGSLNSVDMVSFSSGWAVGGEILRYSGGNWQVVASPTSKQLRSVSMVSSSEGWAVGETGTILHYSGGQWQQAYSPTSQWLHAVEMVSADEGWAVGVGGTILHYRDGMWRQYTSPTTEALVDLAMVSADEGWAVGASGTILHYTVPPRLELFGLEVTQVLQALDNRVMLIRDKPTYVRAHVRSSGLTANNVTAELIGRRDGVELYGSPLRPINTGGSIDVQRYPFRYSIHDSFLFNLPLWWRNGSVDLEFRGVSHPIECADQVGTPNDCKVSPFFTNSPAVEISLVGIAWIEDDTPHVPDAADIEAVADQIEATFPIPRLDWDRDHTMLYASGRPHDKSDFGDLLLDLYLKRLKSGCFDWGPVNCRRYYMGVLVDPLMGGGLAGMGYQPGDVALGYVTDRLTHAHELGHNAGRPHTDYNGQNRINPAEPDPGKHLPSDGTISQFKSGDRAIYGFDRRSYTIKGPETADLMSYGWARWPSNWTYTYIREHLADHYGLSGTAQAVAAEEPAILLSGLVTPTAESGSLRAAYAIQAPAPVPSPEAGDYAIRFEDSEGQEVASYSFAPSVAMPSCAGCTADGETSIELFTLVLPWDASTARMELLHGSQVLDARVASDHPPTVQVTYPNGGESLSGPSAALSWSGGDLDGDPLEYAVQYSTDAGATWLTLAPTWPLTMYELDLELAAGTDQGLIRVLASDGFHTAEDQSDGTFSVAKHAPRARITSPRDGDLFVGQQTLLLEGRAYDNEDGLLDGTALSWSSSLDGTLGSGDSLAVRASTLAEGAHSLTLTAEDSDGLTGTVSITVDIHRQRPTLPASLAAAPEVLTFVATEGGPQTEWRTLAIRNAGDGVLDWTLEVGPAWAVTDMAGGSAPANAGLAADPAGLAIGTYTGAITVTAPGAENSPQRIEVTLHVREPYWVYLPVILRRLP
jgi:photosystem II stability/assembly factor-like uncharacterized protein